jgi:hypothetical protein
MRLRNDISFLYYGIRHKRIKLFTFLINLLILVIALTDIQSILQKDSLFLILVLLFLNIIWQFIGTFSDIAAYRKPISLQEERIKVLSEEITISEKEKTLEFDKLIVGENIVLMSSQINAFCQSGVEPGCLIDVAARKRMNAFLQCHFDVFFLYLKHRFQFAKSKDALFYNEKKLCLSSDIEPDMPVAFFRGTYYDTHVTNTSYFSCLQDADGHKYFSPLYLQDGFEIPSISASMMSNEIGISTMGITSDGYIIVLTQQIRSNAAPGLLVPTGSGSADFGDYSPSGFFDTIIAATQRELFEEISPPKPYSANTIAKTKVLGFFRWVNMGGKPEFLSLSRLNIPCSQIKPNKIEQLPLVKSKYFCDFKNRKIHYESLNTFIEEIMSAEKCSLQLYLNLLVLSQYTHNQADFEAFLFE